jgi:Tfp pilus assembly protein PilN
VEKFFYEDALKQKVDFFNNFRLKQRRQLARWLNISTILLFFLIGSLLLSHMIMRGWSSMLYEELVELDEKITGLNSKMGRVVAHKRKNVALKARQHDFKKNEYYKAKLINFLRFISDVIPSRTWLEKIVFEENKITMDGQAFNAEQVGDFYNSLAGLPIVENCRLSEFSKDKAYRFRLVVKLLEED